MQPRIGSTARRASSPRAGLLRSAAEQAAQAWGDNSSLSLSYTMPWGEEYTAATLVDMYLAELAAHAWDLAWATGQIDKLDPSLAMPALRARAMIKPQYRNMVEPGVPFGARSNQLPVDDGAPRCLHGTRHGQRSVCNGAPSRGRRLRRYRHRWAGPADLERR